MAKPTAIKPVRATRSKTVKLLLYGHPGIGKTRLLGDCPKCLIVRPPIDHTDSIRGGDAEEWVVPDWDEMNRVHDYLRSDGAEEYDWVWLDSISLFQDQGLDDIWETVIAEKPHRARYGLDKQEYGINMSRLSGWVRNLVGLSDSGAFNFGITAHPRELRPDEAAESDEVLMPYIQGKNMSPKICGYMNVVAYYRFESKDGEQKGLDRVLRTRATDRYYGKDQFDAFPNGKLVNPTMEEIIKLIKKSRGSSPRSTAPKRRRRKSTTKGR